MSRNKECPECKTDEHTVMLAVNLGVQEGTQSVILCKKCHCVFDFRPIEDLGPIYQVEELEVVYG